MGKTIILRVYKLQIQKLLFNHTKLWTTLSNGLCQLLPHLEKTNLNFKNHMLILQIKQRKYNRYSKIQIHTHIQ